MLNAKIMSNVSNLDAKLQNGSSGGIEYKIGRGLKVEGNVLVVDTVETIEEHSLMPVSSSAIYKVLGNITARLASI